jgi:hypothetical protein
MSQYLLERAKKTKKINSEWLVFWLRFEVGISLMHVINAAASANFWLAVCSNIF